MKAMNSESCSTVFIREWLIVADSTECIRHSASVTKERRNKQDKDGEFPE
jgi:hypothetical protein